MGIISEDTFYAAPTYRENMLGAQARLGIGTIRQVFDWASIETVPGRFNFGTTDGYVAATAKHHITLLPILFDAPSFRSSAPRRGAKRGFYPPRRNADFGRFAAAAARRYGPEGSFWRTHRSLPREPIRAWQIWNEPNLPIYWASGPNPGKYVGLVRAARSALKRVDRHAEIVTAGLPESKIGKPLYAFIAGMYRAGGRSAFDTLAVHPYAHTVGSMYSKLLRVRGLMNAAGHRRGRIWVTEFGWADKAPANNRGFTEGTFGQAARISGAIAMFSRQRRHLNLRGFVYYNWHDEPPYGGGDFWGLHTGLLYQDGTPKPARDAFARAVSRMR